MTDGLLIEEFGVLVFELSDDVFVEEEGGDGDVWIFEILVEAGFLNHFKNVHCFSDIIIKI